MANAQTSQSLTEEQRERASELLANRWTDNMSLKDLERFFYESQMEYLESYSDSELIGELEDTLGIDEYCDFLASF